VCISSEHLTSALRPHTATDIHSPAVHDNARWYARIQHRTSPSCPHPIYSSTGDTAYFADQNWVGLLPNGHTTDIFRPISWGAPLADHSCLRFHNHCRGRPSPNISGHSLLEIVRPSFHLLFRLPHTVLIITSAHKHVITLFLSLLILAGVRSRFFQRLKVPTIDAHILLSLVAPSHVA
jgi:hypothetical protein